MWVYVYDAKTKRIFPHEVVRVVDKRDNTMYVVYHTSKSQSYINIPAEEGMVFPMLRPYMRSLNCWLAKRDDERARDILGKARIEKVKSRIKEVGRQLEALENELADLENGKVEVSG